MIRKPRCRRVAPALLLAMLVLFVPSAGGASDGALGTGGRLTLRVRMEDGAVKRVQADGRDTVGDLMVRLGMSAGGGDALCREAGGEGSAPSASVSDLGLRHGDFLYTKSEDGAREQAAIAVKEEALRRIKAAATADAGQAMGKKFVPFPDLARPPPPRRSKRVKTWKDIEAMQAQTFGLKPQKDSNARKISVEEQAMNNFVGYLKHTRGPAGGGGHRCALLFGKANPSSRTLKVQAMFEPPQEGGNEGIYDPTALKHFMGATEVATAAALELWAMRDLGLGRDEGALVATVTLPVNQTTGEVATEAYSVSNQTVQMFSEGVLTGYQPEPTSDRVTTAAVVKEGGKETTHPESLGMICNVAIAQHKGPMVTRFPVAHRGEGPSPSLSALKECLFGGGERPGGGGGGQKLPFLKRLTDFQQLLYQSRQLRSR
ncbi:unnamed protein product [Discosporangium mesarthrocarpum]